jgi:hypothetical protein
MGAVLSTMSLFAPDTVSLQEARKSCGDPEFSEIMVEKICRVVPASRHAPTPPPLCARLPVIVLLKIFIEPPYALIPPPTHVGQLLLKTVELAIVH